MLEFDYSPLFCFYVCYVLFTTVGLMYYLLPLDREPVLPGSMPFGFLLPPWIAGTTGFMSPVPNSKPLLTTLGNHRAATCLAIAYKFGLCFLAVSVDESKFHGRFITWRLNSATSMHRLASGDQEPARSIASE